MAEVAREERRRASIAFFERRQGVAANDVKYTGKMG